MEPKTISILEADQRWSGAYETDGVAVCVMSAYGSKRELLGKKPADQVAQEVFRKIVRQRLSTPNR